MDYISELHCSDILCMNCTTSESPSVLFSITTVNCNIGFCTDESRSSQNPECIQSAEECILEWEPIDPCQRKCLNMCDMAV